MPRSQSTSTVGLVFAIGVSIVAILLLVWLVYDRRGREVELSAADRTHFLRQDCRRGLVAFVFLALALGLGVGSAIEPKLNGRANPLFLQVWFAVMILILSLPILVVLDLLATRQYARRHVRALAEEHREILRDELERRTLPRGPDRNGAAGGPYHGKADPV